MLTQGLAIALVKRKVLAPEVNVFVRYRSVGVFSNGTIKEREFLVEKVTSTPEYPVVVKAVELLSGSTIDLLPEQILKIDQMTPEQLAEAFELNLDGEKHIAGKRRGRPRKHFRPEFA